MKQEGRVMRVVDGQAWVQVLRESACGSCHTCGGCEAKGSLIQVNDPLGLEVGERIHLVTDPRKVLWSSALVYTLPLSGLFAGYALGGIWGEGWGVMGSLMGLGLSIPVLRWIDGRFGQKMAVKIKRI